MKTKLEDDPEARQLARWVAIGWVVIVVLIMLAPVIGEFFNL